MTGIIRPLARPIITPERIRSRPLSLQAYGITDAYTTAQVDERIPEILDAVRMRREFNLQGDGTDIETSKIQDVLDAAAARGQIAHFGSMVPVIDAALTLEDGPGIMFDQVSHGSDGGPGFLITGSGYTALTVTGRPQRMSLAMYGTGNTANGIYFDNPLLAVIQHLRVYGLDGFGVKFDKCWDMHIGAISAEECGNASEYAVSFNDSGDSCNNSWVGRLQIEKANTQALFVGGATQNVCFGVIHSEQCNPDSGYDTWFLGGLRTRYLKGLFDCSGYTSADATLHLQPAQCSYEDFLTIDDIDVYVDSSLASGSIAKNLLHHFEVQGTMTFGVQADFDPNLFTVRSSHIATLAADSTHASATFEDCTIDEGGNLLTNTRLITCDVTCASAVAHGSVAVGTLEMWGSVLRAALTYTNVARVRMFGSQITGTVSCGDAGNHDFLCDSQSTVGGSSSGITAAPTGGAHVRGDTHFTPLPSSGATPGWRCTTAGTPGTWKAMANLA